jgi:hypothetical protein
LRAKLFAAIAATAAGALTACSGSTGTHTQSYNPSAKSSAPASRPAGPSASITPSGSASSTSPPSALPTLPTPTVTPAAQDAVTAFMQFYAALNEADLDPQNADVTNLNTFLTGDAVASFDNSITEQAKAGLAYRGTPDDPRVEVGQIFSPAFIFLTSCTLPSSTDPFIQYTVATGQPLALTSPTTPTPWLRTTSMKLVDGLWRVADVVVDSSRTCAP